MPISQCNQKGHKKSQCLSLAAVGKVLAPAPATLRITDGHQGRVETSVAKSRASQLTVEEARATPNVVTDMHFSLISAFIIECFLWLYVLYRVVLSERHFSHNIV